jgi:hypothetical protein
LSTYWRLAAGGAVSTAVISLLGAVTLGYYLGGPHATAFLYGAGIGVVCFTSIALTASLLGGRLTGDRVLLGLGVYVGRLVFAAVGMGVPIYLGSWPVVPIVGGFAGVYVIENVLLLVGVARAGGGLRQGASAGDRNGG